MMIHCKQYPNCNFHRLTKHLPLPSVCPQVSHPTEAAERTRLEESKITPVIRSVLEVRCRLMKSKSQSYLSLSALIFLYNKIVNCFKHVFTKLNERGKGGGRAVVTLLLL